GHIGEEGKVKAIEVEMQDVELACALADLGEHRKMGWDIPGQVRIEPESKRTARHELGAGTAIAARKQSDVVPTPDERAVEMSHDSLVPAVELWWHRFIKGGDLGDAHSDSP